MNFLHTYSPQPILLTVGGINIYWYGLFLVIGMLLGIALATANAKKHGISKELIVDYSFWLIIFGIMGARLYHIMIESRYYLESPLKIFKIWQGGLAIHGAIIAGFLVVWYLSRKKGIDFWKISSILAISLALGQAIGRWGNYFNQELFGRPTSLAWGIHINLANRPYQYFKEQFFHPTFLYESIGLLLIVGLLLFIDKRIRRTASGKYYTVVFAYLIGYSALRFFIEYLRIDTAPVIAGLRLPQIVSIIIAVLTILSWILIERKNKMNMPLEKK